MIPEEPTNDKERIRAIVAARLMHLHDCCYVTRGTLDREGSSR
jgi:hypothetical protein